jgi:hypothetical protein
VVALASKSSGNGDFPLLRTNLLNATFPHLLSQSILLTLVTILLFILPLSTMASPLSAVTPAKPPAPSSAKITATKASPSVQPDSPLQTNEEFEAFLAATPGKVFSSYVTYSSSFSHLQEDIIEAIRNSITKHSSKFSDECKYWSDFKGGTPSRRDIHRILVAFELEEDQQAFKS